MQITDLYKAILASLNVVADENGLLSLQYMGSTHRVLVNGKRMTLPTDELLRIGDWSNLQPFHPLSENLLREGESPVSKKLKTLINLRLGTIVTDLMAQFIQLGYDTKSHAKLSPKAQELLSHIQEVDDKTVAAVDKILEAVSEEGPSKIINIYLKRGGKYKGEKVARLAVVSFPIITDEFERNDGVIYGVKLRKKDYAAVLGLLKYILPDCDDLEAYNAPSNSLEAPYFDALIHAYINVARRLNEVVKIHKKQLENADELTIDLSWIDAVENLGAYRGMIPTLAGNEGETAEKDTPAPVRPIPTIAAPVTAKAPATPIAPKLEEPKQSTFNTSFRADSLNVPAAPAPAAAASPAKKIAGRGADFNEVLRANAANTMRAQQQFHQQMTQPAWVSAGQPAAPAVPVGSYAGMHRGVPVAPTTYGYQNQRPGMGFQQYPDWVQPAAPAQPVGYGFQATPAPGNSV